MKTRRTGKIPAALGGVVLSLVLAANAPARLLGYFFSPEQVHFSGYRGTLWNGAAAHAVVSPGSGWFSLGAVQWRLSPLSLLLLSPRVELESRWGGQRIDIAARRYPGGGLRLYRLAGDFPAELLRQWLPVELRGDIRIRAADLELAAEVPRSGGGRIEWRRAWWVGNGGGEILGDYALDFAVHRPGHLSGTIATLSGPVRVTGTVALEGRDYSVDVRFGSEQGISAALASALELMAAPVNGEYHLGFSSRF